MELSTRGSAPSAQPPHAVHVDVCIVYCTAQDMDLLPDERGWRRCFLRRTPVPARSPLNPSESTLLPPPRRIGRKWRRSTKQCGECGLGRLGILIAPSSPWHKASHSALVDVRVAGRTRERLLKLSKLLRKSCRRDLAPVDLTPWTKGPKLTWLLAAASVLTHSEHDETAVPAC